MFTIETEWDELGIRILDQTGQYEDVEFLIYDDVVYIRQWDEDLEQHYIITLSPQQFEELTYAMNLPEGAYVVDRRQKN
jgi:hypothetical protein